MGIEIGPLHVRRSIQIEATPARVWQEFETFERLAAWFGQGHQLEVYEPTPGGMVRLSVEIDGVRTPFGGEVLAIEPARELSFSNNWEADGWPLPTVLSLRLTGRWDGCHVELFHHGFERLGAEAAAQHASYEAGWDVHHLQALKSIVEGS